MKYAFIFKGLSLFMVFQSIEQTPMVYTIDDAAYILSMSVSSIRRLIKDGQLKTMRISPGSIRITRTELEQYVTRAQEVTSPCPK